ncbi:MULTISPECIES: peptide deformylase [unclassified Streptomyces]|uniref:peptide deformylase n=1 Tax=unclassified Streptomyces TaxID=2593676 RepID=UPI002035F704|nr:MULTISPECIES: peptide deformylase [unclassified Streptomyces]
MHNTAEQAVEMLFALIERIARVYTFAKGMGIAAPQIGIGRSAAVVQPAEEGVGAIVLLNPRVTAASEEVDEHNEGCLSFFDVRGMVVLAFLPEVRSDRLLQSLHDVAGALQRHSRVPAVADWIEEYRTITATGGGRA